MTKLYGDYSPQIVNDWISLLKTFRIKFNFSGWCEKLNFKLYSEYLSQEIDYVVKFDNDNYCAYAKLPLCFDKSQIDEISSFIFEANSNPMFEHFVIDYDNKEIYCVQGTCCRGCAPGWDSIKITLEGIESFIESFYDDLEIIANKNLIAEEDHDSNS